MVNLHEAHRLSQESNHQVVTSWCTVAQGINAGTR